ncbi:MAG: sulfate ABC transporter permease subunit CysT [Planctomycetaceae bacterium]|nr:sulfate ABC transporter permease subunit CysT [Planctomycetaceae bacterium]
MTTVRQRKVLPGFGLTLGYSMLYLGLIVLIPLSAIFVAAARIDPAQLWKILSSPRVFSAFSLSFWTSFAAAAINVLFGLLTAWVLVRYRFFGRRLLDAMIDLPFALPTAVAGITLTTLYAPNGWIGRLLEPLGIKAAFTPIGIVVALTFIGLPFVVRTVQPVLEDLGKELEESASSLGATRFQTFRLVILPELIPSLLTGFALAFARALGEYGSVVFISGNMPGKTETVPLLIITKLEQYDYAGATAIAMIMLVLSFILLLAINLLQRWALRNRETL